MSQFTSVNSECLYVNSACVTGPTIDNLMTGPCVNEEYQEPQFELKLEPSLEEHLSEDELDERVEQCLREEEERYDEMIAADRLKDIDYDEEYYEYIFAGEEERYRVTLEEEEWEAKLDKAVSKA